MTEREVLDVLTRTRNLLADPRRWTRGTEARDDAGNDLIGLNDDDDEIILDVVRSERAASWCVRGALERFAGKVVKYTDPRFRALWDRIDDTVGPWNDRVTHEEMLRALDEAIAVQRRVVEEGAQ